MPERVGRRVQLLREEAGLTQTGLAEKCGVTEGAIRQIEDGTTKSPSFSTGVKLAYALGVSAYELALGYPMPESEPVAGLRLPADLGRLIQTIQGEAQAAAAAAEKAQATADEAIRLLRRRGRGTA
jgi:transcriptional regulator with XRE-family HTH domain